MLHQRHEGKIIASAAEEQSLDTPLYISQEFNHEFNHLRLHLTPAINQLSAVKINMQPCMLTSHLDHHLVAL